MRVILLLVIATLVIGVALVVSRSRPAPAEPPAAAIESGLSPPARATSRPQLTPDEPRPIMQAQVVLERIGFSSGVIDGKEGKSFAAALQGFQQSRDLEPSGKLDAATKAALSTWNNIAPTRIVTIPAAFAQGPFTPWIPVKLEEQSKLPALGYRTVMEKLGERFHTNAATLIELNSPETLVGAGRTIRVPNIGNDAVDPAKVSDVAWRTTLANLGVGATQPKAERLEVDKSEGVLKVFDEDDRLIAQFPATMGSKHDPLPIGEWTIKGTSFNPPFHYDPELFWDASASDDRAVLPPGPNGPVGVVWIDLSKKHYGIHGTPEPEKIGRSESHGCIRLTNWDAARLALMVRPGTTAHLVE